MDTFSIILSAMIVISITICSIFKYKEDKEKKNNERY